MYLFTLELSTHYHQIICKTSHTISPFLFVSSCKVCLPVKLLYTCSFPNFAYRSPSKITVSLFGALKTIEFVNKIVLYLHLFYLLL